VKGSCEAADRAHSEGMGLVHWCGMACWKLFRSYRVY